MNLVMDRLAEGARKARGVAVIIDVFRAFTCAPLYYHFGAREVLLVGRAEEAFELRSRQPDAVLAGEVDGKPIMGFDLGNSPAEALARGRTMFDDKPVIMRTSAGVQGALLALEAAERVLLTGFLTAKATAEVLRSMVPKTVTLVAMGWNMEHPAPEDEWCALYLAHLLGRGHFDPAEALSEILAHQSSRKFFDPELSHLPAEDPAVCLQRDWFDFALEAARDGDLVRITPLRA